MLLRTDIEKRERDTLAPYAMKSADSRGRVHAEVEGRLRSSYQRDRDRIIHSTAFRRLEYKTQVFVNHEGDLYRTRLTHTIEVAQIARSIARALNVNEDLVEAVALAHDVGHTPFGHSGEEALRELMKDHGGFEHNRHGLRVVDVLERRYPGFPGLDLTWEVRESIVKHTSSYDAPELSEFAPHLRPLVEAQVVEVADAIAYDSHDIDDGLRAGILSLDDLRKVELLRITMDDLESRMPGLSDRYARTQLVRHLINREVTDLIEHTQARIEEAGIDSVDAVRTAPRNVVGFSSELQQQKQEIEHYLFENVYHHYRVMRMADKAKRFIRELFRAYVADPRQLPPDDQEWARDQGVHRAVCDYIAGMTDRYAQVEYLKLFAPFEPV